MDTLGEVALMDAARLAVMVVSPLSKTNERSFIFLS
jgi:hypothetical protein